jgi:hypothetical protein
LVAATALSMVPNAVIMITGSSSSMRRISSRTSMPFLSGSMRSSKTASIGRLPAVSTPACPGGHGDDAIALAGQQRFERLANDFLVVDDEDGCLGVCHACACPLAVADLLRGQRQRQAETRALSRLALA